ncbi:transcription factor C6 like protein [Zymoseptoria brevis]|uniref:Transcription factor C6 like protein n=1 Tax=Zymoseptoria brevis TaxID=1047168 RepID=A0A0F4GIG1_9PEZI|nr:transcription factor C6 like protein [Zymoseptoria brevis]
MPAEPSSAAARRRNGKDAACEPCRKAKIKCDNERPVCKRCRYRQKAPSCYYHPAPLTKARGSPADASTHGVNVSAVISPSQVSAVSSGAIAPLQDNAVIDNGVVQSLSNLCAAFRSYDAQDNLASEETISAVVDVLKSLRHLNRMIEMLSLYSKLSQACYIPGPFFVEAAVTLRDTISGISWDEVDRDPSVLNPLACQILSSTAFKFSIPPACTVAEFIAIYTGANLRLETIALVYSLAARTDLMGRKSDERNKEKEELVTALLRNAAFCVSLARDIGPEMNDVLMWASYESFRLQLSFYGETHPVVYRGWSEVTTDLYALGIHRESFNSANVPPFMAETRRRTYHYAYQFDKFISTLFNRPPRISKRYTTTPLPLDWSDDELLGSIEGLDQACARLEDGWNAQKYITSTTWIRVRSMLGHYREDYLEAPYRGVTVDKRIELQNISRNCRQFWATLPEHLKYTDDSWKSGIETQMCLLLTTVYLTYMQLDMQLHQMLVQIDPEANIELLTIAAAIVTAIRQQGAALDRAYARRDISYQNLLYGFPAAVVLATALQKNQPLPQHVKRSKLIRDLSVMVSLLENSISPGEANYMISIEAAKALSRTIDEILDAAPASSASVNTMSTPTTTSFAEPRLAASQACPLFADPMAMDVTDMTLFNGGDLDSFDLCAWAKNMDWPSLGGEWSTF